MIHLDFYTLPNSFNNTAQSNHSDSYLDKGRVQQRTKLLFLELMVQLVNSQIITKTIKVAAENVAVI